MGMLDHCATDLQAKKAEADALEYTLTELQARLDTANQANIELRLEQVSFTRKFQLNDSQLAENVKESSAYVNACSGPAAQVTQQHKESTDWYAQEQQQTDAMHAALGARLEARLEAKVREAACLEGKLEERRFGSNSNRLVDHDNAPQVEDDLRCFNEGKAAGHAEGPQGENEGKLFDLPTQSCARIASLEADNAKLYAQVLTGDYLNIMTDEVEDRTDVDDASLQNTVGKSKCLKEQANISM
ncbi:hypothetical protein N0V95_000865 [Ascochyta clinopodiicola]|nr:hypothetical protein N0V95_000865 [Ascochyta clinopodiicola]